MRVDCPFNDSIWPKFDVKKRVQKFSLAIIGVKSTVQTFLFGLYWCKKWCSNILFGLYWCKKCLNILFSLNWCKNVSIPFGLYWYKRTVSKHSFAKYRFRLILQGWEFSGFYQIFQSLKYHFWKWGVGQTGGLKNSSLTKVMFFSHSSSLTHPQLHVAHFAHSIFLNFSGFFFFKGHCHAWYWSKNWTDIYW